MSTAPTAARTRNILFFLLALCFISHFNRISMAVAGNERIMNDYGIDPDEMGRIYSGFLLVYTIFMAAGGWFIDRYGVRMALGVVAIGSGLCEAATGWLGLMFTHAHLFLIGVFVVRAAMGLVTTPLHPGSAQAVSIWVPEQKRTLANGLITCAALLGVAFTRPLFGKLMDLFHWQRAFVLSGMVTMILGFAWLLLLDDGRKSQEPESSKPVLAPVTTTWWTLLADRNLLLLTVGYAAVGYLQYLFFYWIDYYFGTILHLSKDLTRWYSTIPVLTMAACMPLGGWIADCCQPQDRISRRKRVAGIGMALSSLFLFFGLLSAKTGLMVFWFSLSFGALGASEASFWLTAVEVGGKRGGTAAAIINTGGNGIGLLAPLFTPQLGEHFGWKGAIAVGGVVCMIGALSWLPIRIRAVTAVSELKAI